MATLYLVRPSGRMVIYEESIAARDGRGLSPDILGSSARAARSAALAIGHWASNNVRCQHIPRKPEHAGFFAEAQGEHLRM